MVSKSVGRAVDSLTMTSESAGGGWPGAIGPAAWAMAGTSATTPERDETPQQQGFRAPSRGADDGVLSHDIEDTCRASWRTHR